MFLYHLLYLVSTCIASFSPVIASGTNGFPSASWLTSCARNPSINVFDSSAIKLNLHGLSCFNLLVASKS